jgi:hypothetical protein
VKITIVLVCGGRAYGFKPDERAHIEATLNSIKAHYGELLIIEGGAPGTDTFAGLWADNNDQHCAVVKALWRTRGRPAGSIRNGVMLALTPALCVAFPGGTGTANMVKQAKAAGIETYEV